MHTQFTCYWVLLCHVTGMPSGEAMEKGLRDCCRSMRIGKILIRRHRDSKEPQVYYAKFPPNIEKRKILLLLPVLGGYNRFICTRYHYVTCSVAFPSLQFFRLWLWIQYNCGLYHTHTLAHTRTHTHTETGATVKAAINVLKENYVTEQNIFLVTLFTTPQGANNVLTAHPCITMLTSEVHKDSPGHFSLNYFGSDWTVLAFKRQSIVSNSILLLPVL